jgi:CheY-like chemotaxis protein
MTRGFGRINLMVAPDAAARWATSFAESLGDLPIELHWTRTDAAAVDLAAGGRLHVAVVDAELPVTGGLDVLRRIRRLGIDLPSLLVCNRPDSRLLQAALDLGVYSVLEAERSSIILTPMLCKVVKQVYGVDWPPEDRSN